jgi:hypothetical protein
MNKYATLFKDVYSVFATANWIAESIKTFPDNFVGSVVGDTYIRVGIFASGGSVNCRSVSGLLMIDIFVPAGGGTKEVARIADKLDTYLAGQEIKTTENGKTFFVSSNLAVLGNDRDNPSLYRASYSIPFNYFGV